MIQSGLMTTPLAALSRPVCGAMKSTLIITLPGSPKGAVENLQSVVSILPHALELLRGNTPQHEVMATEEAKWHEQLQGSASSSLRSQGGTVGRKNFFTTLSTTGEFTSTRDSPYPMLSVEEALSVVMRNTYRMASKIVPVNSALVGYILAENVQAVENVPNFRTSMMDGYAVCGKSQVVKFCSC